MSMEPLSNELRLPDYHPWPHKQGYQCSVCDGISFPEDPSECPYCAEEAEKDAA